MRLYVDTQGVSFMVSKPAVPKTDRATGQQRQDKETERPLWLVQLVAQQPGVGADVLNVTVADHTQPKMTEGQQVQVSGLEAIPWVQGDRHGVAYRAQSITTANAAPSKAA